MVFNLVLRFSRARKIRAREFFLKFGNRLRKNTGIFSVFAFIFIWATGGIYCEYLQKKALFGEKSA